MAGSSVPGYEFCANCDIYDWEQLSDTSKLLRCSRCKFISYCSSECQQEHWVKVHRKQCKYMSKQKECPMACHDPATCPGCRKQAEIGLVEMSKSDNPCLGCPWDIKFLPQVTKPYLTNVGLKFAEVPLPLKLGEMSGKFLTKAEHTVSILHHLVHKLELTMHPAWTIHPDSRNNLCKMVNTARRVIWHSYVHDIPKNHLERSIPKIIKPQLIKMLDIAFDIDLCIKVKGAKSKDQSVFRPWDTFKLFLNILLQQYKNMERMDAVKIGIPEIFKDDIKLMVSPAQFSNMWKRMLDSMMDGNLLPYTDLLKIACGDDLKQMCYGCSKDIIVADVWFENKEVPFIYQSYVQAYLCGEPDCFYQVDALDNKMYEICSRLSLGSVENICHNCFLMSSGSVHRCTRCMTKYYCGEECRDEDWAKVHKLLCKEGQERKKKGGKQARNLKGIEMVDYFVKAEEELLDTGVD